MMIEEELKFVATPEKGETSALLVRPEGATTFSSWVTGRARPCATRP